MCKIRLMTKEALSKDQVNEIIENIKVSAKKLVNEEGLRGDIFRAAHWLCSVQEKTTSKGMIRRRGTEVVLMYYLECNNHNVSSNMYSGREKGG